MEQNSYIPVIEIVRHDARALQYLASRGYVVIARRRSTGKERSVPLRSLLINNARFFRETANYAYFVTSETAEAVYKAFPKHEDLVSSTSRHNTPPPQQRRKQANFGEEYQDIAELEPLERVAMVESTAAEMHDLSRTKDHDTANKLLVKGTVQTVLANKATIQEALRMGNAEAQRHSASLLAATEKMINGTQALLDADLYKEDLIADVVQRSNGTVVQHMTRVFLMGFQFLLYYNREYTMTSLASQIRAHFSGRYREYYTRLLPHLDDSELSLERVFWGGMRALTTEEIRSFAIGFLVHDVGKAEDIEYHEGEEGFDKNTVVRHVKIGYKAVMDKTIYPREAALITGYHHEYYGDPSGYGYFREFLDNYKQMNPDAHIDHLMAYEMEPLIDYQVLAYFPAKMLEVVDVFDSLTDANRLYREPLTPQQTVDILYSDFLKEKVKVDPIILDLFTTFLRERDVISR